MFIINKSESIQRTRVKWEKTDIKPGEIVEVLENEWLYVTKSYSDIFSSIKIEEFSDEIEESKELETKKKSKRVSKK
jgi:hypothetical protein